MTATTMNGTCDPRFEAVRDCFAEGFETRDEIGAAVAVTIDGAPVVDLWAGHRDLARTLPWERDTIVNVYSTTKGMTALCALRLAERRELDLDAPVAKYWPEFGCAGKEEIPVRWLLGHRGGISGVRPMLPPEALFDWDAMCTALAAEEPWWTPGTNHGYHAVTYGWLVGEVVRRISGRSLGTFFREEIAEPLGLDFHIGLPASEHDRCAEMSPMAVPPPDFDEPSIGMDMLADPEGIVARAFANPISIAAGPNNAEWRSAEIPAANGHGTARSLARVYGALSRGGEVDGVRVLAPETIELCHTELSYGPDLVLQTSTRFGHGFMLTQPVPGGSFGPNTKSFGHPGMGGSFGYADPDARIGFGYVMNRMGPHILLDPRVRELIAAIHGCL